jgi:hypothetical protein
LSSGKLDLNAVVRNDKFNSTIAYSDIPYPTIDLEATWDPNLTNFSQINHEVNKFYSKAFEIHLLLLRNEKLSNQEKLEYCKIERSYIKLYLKAIMMKNYI